MTDDINKLTIADQTQSVEQAAQTVVNQVLPPEEASEPTCTTQADDASIRPSSVTEQVLDFSVLNAMREGYNLNLSDGELPYRDVELLPPPTPQSYAEGIAQIVDDAQAGRLGEPIVLDSLSPLVGPGETNKFYPSELGVDIETRDPDFQRGVDKVLRNAQLGANAQPRVSISDGQIEGVARAYLKPELSGQIPFYTNGHINVRNTPGEGWSIDWDFAGQRVWMPLVNIDRRQLAIVYEHLKEEQHFPRELAAFCFGLLNLPLPTSAREHLQQWVNKLQGPKKPQPFRNPQKKAQKAEREKRRAERRNAG